MSGSSPCGTPRTARHGRSTAYQHRHGGQAIEGEGGGVEGGGGEGEGAGGGGGESEDGRGQ